MRSSTTAGRRCWSCATPCIGGSAVDGVVAAGDRAYAGRSTTATPSSACRWARWASTGCRSGRSRWPSPTPSSTTCTARATRPRSPPARSTSIPAGAAAWPAEYPAGFRDLLPPLAGYRHYTDADVPGSPGRLLRRRPRRHRYDMHDPSRTGRAGCRSSRCDPFGAATPDRATTSTTCSRSRATDAAGLSTTAVHDYRCCSRGEVVDVNGNTSAVTFSPAGFVVEHFVRGQGWHRRRRPRPSTRMTYDLLAFAERGQPASVRTVRRVHRDTDTGVPGRRSGTRCSVSVQFSDGFGRVVQTRALAEDTLFGDPLFGGGVIPADQSAPVGDTAGVPAIRPTVDNVVVSGWKIYDNKGRVVREVRAVLRHRVRLRAARRGPARPVDADVLRPARAARSARSTRTAASSGWSSASRRDLADPDRATRRRPWEIYTYDANDNAGRTHRRHRVGVPASTGTPRPAPRSTPWDARSAPSPATARPTPTGSPPGPGYDIQGNLLSVTDPLGREVFRYTLRPARAAVAGGQHRRRPARHRAGRARHAGRDPRQQGRARARRGRRPAPSESGPGRATTPAGR